jgi:glutamyl endopeptidase
MWTSGSLNGTNITVTGYPGDIATSINDKNDPNVQGKGTYMWYCNGTITNSLPARLEYNADTWGGNSGGPVYNNSNQALAINTYGIGSSTNGGTRITEWLYNFLVQFQS